LFSRVKLSLSSLATMIAVLMLSVAIPSTATNIIVHRQQQEALAIQADTRTPTTNADCGQVVEGLVELNPTRPALNGPAPYNVNTYYLLILIL